MTFPGLAITLTSENRQDPAVVARTILTLPKRTGGGRAGGGIRLKFSVVLFDRGQDPQECHLTGFTIQGGYGAKVDLFQGQTAVYAGGGVLCLASSPTVSHNVFQKNRGERNPPPRKRHGQGESAVSNPMPRFSTTSSWRITASSGDVAMMVMGGWNPPDRRQSLPRQYRLGHRRCLSDRRAAHKQHLCGKPVRLGHRPSHGSTCRGCSRCSAHREQHLQCRTGRARTTPGRCFGIGLFPQPRAWKPTHGLIHPALLDGGTLTPDPQTWLSENGNIGGDPVFVDARIGDFSLQADLPCINAGNPGFDIYSLKTDLAGKTRVFAKRVDIGAFEFAGLIDPLADGRPGSGNSDG